MEVHEALRIRERVDQTLFAGTPNAAYLQALRYTSGEIGRFVEAVSNRPGWDNTLLVITSDHGEGLTDHPDVPMSTGHGWLLYESQLLVPLILHGPAAGLPAGLTIDRPVRLLDLVPTILDLARIPLPDRLQGVSLMPLIRGDHEAITPPDRFFVETEIRDAEKIGVYTTEWKYIENRDGHEGTNPRALQRIGVTENGRLTDVADRFPEVTERLRAALGDWERRHPRVPPVLQGDELSDAEKQQLRWLGYLD